MKPQNSSVLICAFIVFLFALFQTRCMHKCTRFHQRTGKSLARPLDRQLCGHTVPLSGIGTNAGEADMKLSQREIVFFKMTLNDVVTPRPCPG